MTLTSIGDLARGLAFRHRTTQIKTQIDTLSQELATGRVANVAERLRGDYSQLADIDRNIARLGTLSVSTFEARLFADAMQTSLAAFETSLSDLSSGLLSLDQSDQAPTHERASDLARTQLDAIMAALNARAGGRSLFSGTATDKTPLAPPETLLTALKAELAGATTAAEIQQAAKRWFDDPAGFQVAIYQGATNALAPMQISESERIELPIKADDHLFRDALRHAAVAALAADPSLALAPDQRTALLRDAGAQLVTSTLETVALRAQVGGAEARADRAATTHAAARTSLEHARSELIGADPYETATRLQNVQFQLESLYSVIVRNANLSLANFLR
ncbi:flagellar biosynthesis protein FlgL [Ruegeria sediminis]|uniref:Flagellar biosynthesis protein FlgL n=1 Tax=Ruegeria sediminis TaxID=2583820 RepID=A0ABY2WX80_9RHOB|nr:flagellin [Ruegeria sediminis]TMV07110.1 flagellar biosynthesis protein FlgL [Ruegeria sediminis]